ncbi:UPF0182 family membrane protein [Nocardioides pacificus]
MSDMFGDGAKAGRPAPGPQPAPGRSRALLITAVVLVLAFLALTGISSFWTERLWFRSLDYGSVFTTLLWTRVGLFLIFGAVMVAAVAVNLYLAYRFRPLFRPPSPEQSSLERYREAVHPVRLWLLIGISSLMGVFAGTSAAGQWREYQLWRNGGEFGSTDAQFGRDIGFYVFDLPWLHFLVDFSMAVLVVSLMAAAVVHYVYGGIRLQGRGDRLTPAAQAQLSALLGLFVLVKALDYWLDRFDLTSDSGGLFTGPTYTDVHAVLPAKNILAGIALICAVLFFLNVWRRTWLLPSMGLAMLVLSAVLLGMIWPAIVQKFQVDPSEADKEEKYLARNIEATRTAYDIDDAEIEAFSGETDVTAQTATEKGALARSAINSPGIRLVDPQVVQQTFEQRQQVRGYYSVADVLDVDRYQIGGQERDVVLGVRELDQSGITASSQNWANLHTVYTHGYGVIAAFGNQRPADNEATVQGDEPAWAEENLPPTGELTNLTEDGYEGRIYFGEKSPQYSIVGKSSEDAGDIELDLPGNSGDDIDRATTYDGESGVGIGNFLNKLLYAVKFGEPNLVLSGRVHENSKILYDRDPALMVEKVAPWLTVDSDPFPAVVDGRVVWLLDGYTTTDQYPMSEKESFEEMTDDSLASESAFQTLPTDQINYMRNAVKATVDAYDGTVTLYEWDEEDPILEAWTKAFPDTVEPKAEIPEAILEHMRYPEDLFKVQRYQLGAYHVEDASDFYEANDRWEVPADPNNTASLQPPYRLSVPAGTEQDRFSLTSVYTPANRENLAAFVSVDADAAEDGYGTIRVKRLGDSSQVFGPGQIANQIQSDEVVTDALFPFRQGSTKVVNGNLLTLPVGEGLLYVQPLYTLRTTGDGNFPVLRFVAVSFGDNNVGIGKTLGEAIFDVLGLTGDPGDTPDGEEPTTTPDTGGGDNGDAPLTGTVAQQVRQLLTEADALYDEADAALADGDPSLWAEKSREAQAKVEEAIEKALAETEEAPGEGAGQGAGQGSGDDAGGADDAG